jgi:PAS domain S-box-containing protein
MTPSRSGSTPLPHERLAALEALDDVIICVDPDLRVVSWNPAAEMLHDRRSTDVIGTPIMQIIAPEARLEEGKLLQRALAGERVARHDTIFLRSDGGGVPLSVTIGPIGDGSGNVAGLVLLGRDLAAQQRLQTQLLQSRRMESAGHLAGGIAHEFNNILTAILALAEFTLRDLPPNGGSREDLEEIRQQATKGARLVRHLLAFGRRQLLRTEVVHVGTIFRELEPLLQRLVSERILLATDIIDDSHVVDVDRAQLELVLLELVANACDALPNGGTVTIGVKPVTVSPEKGIEGLKPGDYVQFSVHDTGAGIDSAIQSRVMDPFFTTKSDGHAGLGLAMIDGVIHQHGGTVALYSAPGKGTTVRVFLPGTKQGAVEPDLETIPGSSHGGNETILVVEDETAVRNVICRSLRARGYNIIEAKNGEDALLAAEKHNAPIHLVVTDIVMPEMGGTELFEHLRRWYPTMRILFISGYAKGAIPPEALEEGGGAGFLPKPFTLDQLAAEVRRVISLPRLQAAR